MLDSLAVTSVAGVGRVKAQALATLGVHTVADLLHYFPVRYEDHRIQPLAAYQDGERVTVRAVVEGAAHVRWHQRRSICTAVLRVDQRHRVTGVWFNQPYLKEKLYDGCVLVVSGRWDAVRHTLTVARTDFTGQAHAYSAWSPVYRGTEQLPSHQLQGVIQQALRQYGEQLPEVLPQSLADKYRLVSHRQAVTWMHAPADAESLRQARRRLVFEEFFLFQLQLQVLRSRRAVVIPACAKQVPEAAWATFQAALPFPLTGAQRRACATIREYLSRPQPMSLLVQGDVGSGKTWVALWAAYATYCAGQQTALMAPTEILAEQHYAEAQRRLGPLGVPVWLLTGSTPSKQRQAVLAQVRTNPGLLVGTHALLTEDVEFAHLGLVITDEQHRFGVHQRSQLRRKGGGLPDALLLSATPIPRTLALAVYGDMDVAVLDELPSGRKPVHTRWLPLQAEDEAIQLARRELAAGRQVYVVAPLLEESEQLREVASATQLWKRLSDRFAGYTVGLLHGRLSGREKDAVMRRFVAGEVQVLVSTTVIEVGIHVERATVMLIYHAERFGLAQLHQLRGRVGRGAWQSYCVLLSDAQGGVAEERLRTLTETQDGFAIAERDLALRGPGELLGVRQSGLPEFAVGDLTKDYKIMEVARQEAAAMLNDRDFWLLPAFAGLRQRLFADPSITGLKD
ncbi:MAG: ATP-dependent DNA helicase RecG [Alicyclobacillus sp.]|nr:ATP-dependent DNA helicase RecG [Alicyclobacillus sp.]